MVIKIILPEQFAEMSKTEVKRNARKSLYRKIDEEYRIHKKRVNELKELKKRHSLKGKKAHLFFQFVKPDYAYNVFKRLKRSRKLKWSHREICGYVKTMKADRHLVEITGDFKHPRAKYLKSNLGSHIEYYCKKNRRTEFKKSLLIYIFEKYPEIVPDNFNSRKYKDSFEYMDTVITNFVDFSRVYLFTDSIQLVGLSRRVLNYYSLETGSRNKIIQTLKPFRKKMENMFTKFFEINIEDMYNQGGLTEKACKEFIDFLGKKYKGTKYDKPEYIFAHVYHIINYYEIKMREGPKLTLKNFKAEK